MPSRLSLLAVLVFVAGLLFPAQAGALLPPPDPATLAGDTALVQPQWTVWGASQYALADDGASIWIGAVGGVVQWDKAAGTYRRFTNLDGLPQREVRSIAVDGSGNRWFGGPGGLSRLDAGGNWTHLTAANSGLWSDEIAALAVATDGALYVAHALPDGVVSRLSPAGEWRLFPDRYTVIQADYAAIAASSARPTDVWTVAGAEVWVGHWVFDGAVWRERPLPAGQQVEGTVASGDGHVWARTGGRDIYEWDGQAWQRHYLPHVFSRQVTALAVDAQGTAWAGLEEASTPYRPDYAVVRQADGENGHFLNVYGPVAALLTTSEGLWAVGPGWLMTPDFKVTTLPDAPQFQDVWDAVSGAARRLWVASRPRHEGYQGAVQRLDDGGTTALEDDRWESPELSPAFECYRATALDRLGSDTWYATSCASRTGPPPLIMRDHNGTNVKYAPALPHFSVVSDIFVIDARRAWFAVVDRSYRGGAYLVGLDDGGTPLKLDDDVWQTLDLGATDGRVSVAVDAQGQLWRGQGDGLYRYDGAGWRHEYDGLGVCDLTPGRDGALYAQLERERGAGCEKFSDTVLAVKPDGTVDEYGTTVESLVYSNPVSVRSATRRNSMWSIAPDGAIWYVARGPEGSEVRRVACFWTLTRYAAPFAVDSVRRLEVDALGRAWIVAEGALWRMEGPRPAGVHLPMIMR